MRFSLLSAIALSLSAAPALAQVTTAPYYCWMETEAGIVSLEALCQGSASSAAPETSRTDAQFLRDVRELLVRQPFGDDVIESIDEGSLDPVAIAQNYCDRRRSGQSNVEVLRDYARIIVQPQYAGLEEEFTTGLATITIVGTRFYCPEFR